MNMTESIDRVDLVEGKRFSTSPRNDRKDVYAITEVFEDPLRMATVAVYGVFSVEWNPDRDW